MGNIKTNFVKRVGRKIYEMNADKFSDDYSKNREIIRGIIDIKSKDLRNKIAGYVTNLKKQEGR